ncbi:AzlD domain-containing protein [Streptomyces spiralis]|uniref:AzlD domain-containing protein n=1 Tax=Streptomyces spiralis TaxID=66376 RepID=UPI0036B20A4C
MNWTWVVVAAAGCFALKLAGLLVPGNLLRHPATARVAGAIPVALLAALISVQTFTDNREIVLDSRIAGVLVATLAVWLRAPFLVVVAAAAATTALLRWLGAAA